MTDSKRFPGVLAPPRPSVIRRPGIPALPAGVERYRVKGRGTTVVKLAAGDRATIKDVEGGQLCEVSFVDSRGRFNAAGLGATFSRPAFGLLEILSRDDDGARRTLNALKRRGVALAGAQALVLFGETTPAGECVELTIVLDGLLIVAAPGPDMDAERQNTTTALELSVVRSTIERSYEEMLPEPMADPIQDLRIRAATASAYFVRAGEFIQIIDVSGRQCTDFQAFAARKVDKGLDLALDATVTRTLLGRSYPTPGLPSKAFDRDFEPLVEIVQDTVGRHDAFATACNSRYYDDMGYPGHANCTDNFNHALKPYGIAPRKGWEALNYFYNTNIDHHNQLYLDEPWSRPGDYVLMRAMTDLVCVSSSCPDDIDAANGWDPTDIHVRTYSGREKFSRAVAIRMTPDAEPEMTQETAFHPRFSALTRNLTEYRGYWLANRFNNDGPIEEYWACREKAIVTDLSPLRKFEVTGPDAEALLQYCVTRDIRKLSPGQVVYTAMCYENGGMIDDGTVFRLGLNNFRWIGGDDVSGLWLREQAEKKGFKAWVRSSTDQMHNLAVQGPRSREIIKEIIWTSPAQPSIGELEWFRFAVGRIGHFEGAPVVVSRTGYTGELGYEIFCHPKDALAVFDAVWEAGQKHGLKPMGLEALDMVRIEAGLVFARYDFSDQTDPFEAGIGFTVPLKSKTEDFIGREALIQRKENPRYKLVGLDIDANEAVGHGDTVHIGRAQVGVVTSSTRSPLLKKTIALARMDVLHSAVGTDVEIGKLDGQQKRLPGRIVPFAHYDPEKLKPRS
ncbi:aminomethyltransferase family protein [Rhizobium herbae]|uniref:Aminomethyltransferase family protein n=1 Tax=Rhizobium herbae TaxID=508661 RepID=A0ABS7HF59_9HYPH|nr:aminomethyltransferase family protein [Rhizobium herbae]MBW9065921.1 aminomethyltransferase family protein [Rhizobium herbae]